MKKRDLSALSPDTPCQLDILRHDGDPLGVDSAQVGVFEETYEVSFAGLLESHDGRGLEPEIGLEVLSYFSDEALERQFADEELSAFLVTTDLSKSDSSGTVPVRFLDTASGGSTFPRGFGGQLLPGGLSTRRLPGCLLGSGHLALFFTYKLKVSEWRLHGTSGLYILPSRKPAHAH